MRLVVFDLDGTLVDSRRDLADSANELIVHYGGTPLPEETIGRFVGEGAARLVARTLEAAGLESAADALPRFLAIYDSHLLRWTRAYDGVPEALAALSSRTPLAILTNKPIAQTRRILEELNLARFFDASRVKGGDGPHPRKPDPTGLLQLAREAGVSEKETMLVGDSMIDLLTARAAKCRCCLVRYGFGFESFPPGALDSDVTIVDRASELVDLL